METEQNNILQPHKCTGIIKESVKFLRENAKDEIALKMLWSSGKQ